mmetsp:Transcript_26776/g.75105  ORF Transcript_26776/g.75105 Transcript_26776/m.75105 type:complete len:245 (+) Transcript_26776:604-1338(+)|eukprot:CAMPEP_0119552632 /NCGR_PEP_ID=MMETSP1352-20130426/5565_1 /TAXON_ID=265584 /ORGANISM="Stauroneis constricta, Strain CCMP1120" /LENGTH=244 /DNA_ID=CAMNT_0007598889 /DNA_START=597 /DNA_END=1331 /DNA_ORIENTATION=-
MTAISLTNNGNNGDNSQPAATLRRVSFNERVRCKFTLHHCNYTDEEREAAWMTAEDMASTKEDVRNTLAAIQAGELPMQRGLEFRTRVAAKRRVALKNEARAIVLDEQADQRQSGENDVEYIARLYSEISQNSQRQAELRAHLDEQVAAQLKDEGGNDASHDASSIGPQSPSSSQQEQQSQSQSQGPSSKKKEHSSAPFSSSGMKRILSATRVAPTRSKSSSLPNKLTKSLVGPIRLLVAGKAA